MTTIFHHILLLQAMRIADKSSQDCVAFVIAVLPSAKSVVEFVHFHTPNLLGGQRLRRKSVGFFSAPPKYSTSYLSGASHGVKFLVDSTCPVLIFEPSHSPQRAAQVVLFSRHPESRRLQLHPVPVKFSLFPRRSGRVRRRSTHQLPLLAPQSDFLLPRPQQHSSSRRSSPHHQQHTL